MAPGSGVPEVDGSGTPGVEAEVEMSGVLAPPSVLSLSFSFLSFLFLLTFSFSALSEVPLTFGPKLGLSFPVSAARGGVGAADLFAR